MSSLPSSSCYLQPSHAPVSLGSATHVPAALGSATWSWHRDWFDRFRHTHEQLGAGAGQACRRCPCLPTPKPSLTSASFPTCLKRSCRGSWKAAWTPVLVLLLPQHVTMGKPLSLLGPQCLHLHSGALESVILRQPQSMILVRALPFFLRSWTSHSTPSASGSERVKWGP